VQAKRAHDGQVQLQSALEKIRSRVETIKTDNDRPINVGPINVVSPTALPKQPNAAVRPEERRDVLLDCEPGFLPLRMLPYVPVNLLMLNRNFPVGVGSMTKQAPTEDSWGAEYHLEQVCRLVNYTDTALLTVHLSAVAEYKDPPADATKGLPFNAPAVATSASATQSNTQH
jgi:hypothetical protein